MFIKETALAQLTNNLNNFPLLNQYLASSLKNRAQQDDWYDNRVIRYILRNSQWVYRLEREFRDAQVNLIENSKDVFNLQGRGEYDQQLFDAFAEIRLASWARNQGYTDIVKLKTSAHKTPDFSMTKPSMSTLAEARHFRVRDYVIDLVYDRLDGLALKTDGLTKFGLKVEADDKYDHEYNILVGPDRSSLEAKYREMVKSELTEEFFLRVDKELANNPNTEIAILEGLLVIKRDANPGVIDTQRVGSSNREANLKMVLPRLCAALLEKLEQIQAFLDATGYDATHAVVFFSGIDDYEIEWSDPWDTLADKTSAPQWVRDYINTIHSIASASIRIPFDLIVGRGNSVKYEPFPW